ncbi:MAG: helix-turn-helix domain-containing protein [Novosphingobium sp.]
MGQASVGQVLNVAVIAPPDPCLSSIGALVDSVRLTRRYIYRQYGAIDVLPTAERFDLADLHLLTIGTERVLEMEGITLTVEGRGIDGQTPDLVFIADYVPAGDRPEPAAPAFAAWLRERAQAGATIAASGASVALLASTGLLDGHKASAPWWMLDALRSLYPQVAFSAVEPLAEEGQLLTSAGAAVDHLLSLRLMERIASRNSALWLQRRLFPQDGLLNPSPALADHDILLARAQQWLTEHLSQPVTVQQMAEAMQVNRRTLHRHFVAGTGQSPHAWLQMLRIGAAKSMLTRSTFSIERISGLVGYSDVSFFRQIFRRETGASPLRWRQDARRAGAGRQG